MKYSWVFPYAVSVLLLSPVGSDGAEAPPKATVGNVEYTLVAKCAHDQYNMGLTVARNAPAPLNLVFALKDANNYYRLTIDAKTCSLFRMENGAEKLLQSAPAPALQASDKPVNQNILIKRRPIALSIVVGSTLLLDVLDSAHAVGVVGIDPKSGTLVDQKYQPCAPVEFTADFMRDEKETGLDPWVKTGGEWQFHSVKEKHSGARPQYSSNAFSFGGKGGANNAPGIVTTGYDFWDDYDAAVSVKSSGSPTGLIFYCRAPNDYFVVRWALDSIERTPKKIALVRVSPQGTKTLAEGYAVGATEQWYRLEARIRGSRIRVSLDGAPMFDVNCPEAIGGKIGLYAGGAADSYFDDVAVKSSDAYELSRADVLTYLGRHVGTAWTTTPDPPGGKEPPGGVQLCPSDAGETTCFLGDPGWKKTIFTAQVKPSAEAQGVGVSAGAQVLFRWGGKAGPYANKKQLILMGKDNKPTVLAEAVGGFEPGRVYRLALDLTEGKRAKLYIDGVLELMAPLPGEASGEPALWALNAKGAEFAACRMDFSKSADWEHEPENKIFAQDRFMLNWASRQGHWAPHGNNLFWHKGDFYGCLSASIPLRTGYALAFCADGEDFKKGYGLEVAAAPAPSKDHILTLTRLGAMVKQATVKSPPDGEGVIEVNKEGRYIRIGFGGSDLIAFRDDSPLPGTRLGMRAPDMPDFAKLPVKRDHVWDCLFEQAPADWERIGTWEVTNRFSCTPWWAHMTGRSRGVAILWNKIEFSGNMTIEYYVGLRMRQSTEMLEGIGTSYPRMGDMNLTFCGDGRDLDSGYNFVLSAWDRKWSETWTELRRGGEVVAKTDKFLAPRTRENQSRRIEVPWMPEYNQRPIHGAWYYIKIRKIGNRIECYFDDELVLTYDDPKPLPGKRVALWTQDNSIVVARAKISYESKFIPAQLLPAPKPSPEPPKLPRIVVTSSTHPGLMHDFEGDLCGWASTGADQGAELSLDGSTCSQGKESLKLTNLNAGGDFGATIPTPTLQLPAIRSFSFDYKLSPEVKVNLYMTINGRLHFVEFTGESYSDENVIRLGKIAGVAPTTSGIRPISTLPPRRGPCIPAIRAWPYRG